jgi:SurA-like protein
VIRRVFALVGGGAALLTFASCSTFDTGDAATVNGTDITVDDLQAVRDDIAANAEQFATGADLDQFGGVNGDLTRAVLSVLVNNAVARSVLADAGASVSDAQMAEATSALGEGVPEGPATQALAEREALGQALDGLPAPDAAQLQAKYEDRPASTGVVCAQIVSATTEDAAVDAAEALEAGEAPPTSDGVQAQSGCFPVEQLSGSMGVDDRDLLLSGRPGDVSDPIAPDAEAGSPTWTVLQLQPWAQAEADLTALFAGTTPDGTPPPSPGRLMVTGALATADVTVASEYGRWDQLSGNVVALTPAAEDATAGAA